MTDKGPFLLDAVFQVANVGICVTDESGTFVLVNDSYCKLYGYSREELIGKNFSVVVQNSHVEEVKEKYHNFLQGEPELEREWVIVKKTGEQIDVLVTEGLLVTEDGSKFKVTTVEDISDLKRNKKQIQFLTTYNALTNLPNRMLFEIRLKKEIKQIENTKNRLAMLYIDIDRFKHINDRYGFQAGDMVLREFAARLQTVSQDDSLLGYFGVDKFGVMIGNILPSQSIDIVVDLIIKRAKEPYIIEGHTIRISCSIGICYYSEENNHAEAMIKNSEEAMMQAKLGGRSMAYEYNDAMSKMIQRRQQIEADLPYCVGRKQLFLVYQPQIDLRTGQIVGVEALLRWNHPKLGMIPPSEFIPIAERTEAIHKLGDWVLMEICRRAVRWEKLEINLSICMNISSHQLGKANAAERILKFASHYNMKPHRIELEITESAIIEDIDSTVEKLIQLKNNGIRCSIDDFGTGYSSLNYLRQLPIYKLKIDKSFVEDLDQDIDSRLIVKTIIDMAHNLGFQVIAEGVETEAQMNFLRDNGCDEIQGYYFSKPLSSEKIEALVQNI